MASSDVEDLSLPELFAATARRLGDHPAVIGEGVSTGFAELAERVARAAGGLAAAGVGPGERVGLYCVNGTDFVVAYMATAWLGATVVPVNLLLNPREVAYILQDSGACALIYHAAFDASVAAIRDGLPGLRRGVRIGPGEPPAGDLAWSTVSAGEPRPPARLDPANDLLVILYTSGTTGQPKGAMLTHRNLVANTWSAMQAMRLEPGHDVVLVVLPMFHAFAATVGMLMPLTRGATLVPLPRFDPEQVANAVLAHGVTVLPMVPSMYSTMLRLPEEFTGHLASLRFCVSGAAAMPSELMERFEARFGKLIYEGDGPSECGPVTCVNPIGGLRKPMSVGPAVPGVQMRILDEQGNELPRGEVGEICVRGPNVMKGYWNRPQDTREAFFGEWFRTGDLGHEDADGYFYIVDRKKDLVIVNGMNVYPRVIEEVLHRMPGVAEAAVVGEPHELHGEIPVAFVVCAPGEAPGADAVRAWCREHLGRHEVPRKVFFRDKLPRNAAGKVLKRELRTAGELERGVDSRRDG